MKVRLLNDGGFRGFKKLNYNTVFNAIAIRNLGCTIDYKDLIAAGAEAEHIIDEDYLYFSNGTSGLFGKEYEVVED